MDIKDIIQTGGSDQRLRIVLQGVPGVGKTSFAASMPSPIFIQAEDGLAGVQTSAFPLATKYSDVMEQLRVIFEQGGDFETVVIDTIDALERLIWAQVSADEDVKSIESIGYGKGYQFAMTYWQQLINALNALRDKGKHICLLSHTSIVRFQSPIVESYDRYEIALHKNARALIVEWADIVGFANWQTLTKSEDAGFNKKVAKGIGTGARKLHLVERPAWCAKNRFSLPDEVNLSWQELNEAIEGNKS